MGLQASYHVGVGLEADVARQQVEVPVTHWPLFSGGHIILQGASSDYLLLTIFCAQLPLCLSLRSLRGDFDNVLMSTSQFNRTYYALHLEYKDP